MADMTMAPEVLAPDAAGPTFDGLINGLAQNNPSLAWLPQLMAMRRQRELEQAPATGEIDELRAALRQWQTRAEKMYRRAQALQAELAESQERMSDIAAALGACGLCWGEDDGCPGCRGRGKPGHFAAIPHAPHTDETQAAASALDASAAVT